MSNSECNPTELMNFLQLDEKSAESIRRISSILERELSKGLDKFYERVRSSAKTAKFFENESHMARAKNAQMRHWDAIRSGNLDERYFSNARAIGMAHARIGLEPHWHMSGYAVLLDHLVRAIVSEAWPKSRSIFKKDASQQDAEKIGRSLGSLIKAVFLDMDIGVSTYAELTEEARSKSEVAQAQERELVIASFGAVISKLAANDLTSRMNADLPETFRKLQVYFNSAASNLEQNVSNVANSSMMIRSATEEISTAAEDMAKRTEQQAATLEQTSASLEEVTVTVKKTAEGATHAAAVVATTKSGAEASGDIVQRAVAAMGRIEKSSREIGQIIGVIDEIAFQTNLLALNAGVEAARAGDAGRGFAVVASEVRALAQRSAEAAKEIKNLISASTTEVQQGVELVDQTGKALEKIVAQVSDVNRVIMEIAAGAKEQAAALGEVNVAVTQLDQNTQQNAAIFEQTTAAAQNLRKETEMLENSVRSFRFSESYTTRHSAPKPRTQTALKHVARSGGAAVRKPEPVHEGWEEF